MKSRDRIVRSESLDGGAELSDGDCGHEMRIGGQQFSRKSHPRGGHGKNETGG
jgi:hypothetical protein